MATYENIGTHAVLGHAPGEVFEADLDFVTETRLTIGGHLKRVTPSSASPSAAGGHGAPYTNVPVTSLSSRGVGQKNDADTPDADDDVAA